MSQVCNLSWPSVTPIARKTLRDLTGASPRMQQGCEKKARVRTRGNVALGAPLGHIDPQEVAWRRGRSSFQFRDGAGAYGPAGQNYHAWRLPNSYQGPFPAIGRQRRRRGRKHQRSHGNKRTDQDLRQQGDAGNRQRRYAGGARALARLLRSRPGGSFYWHLPDRLGMWCYFGKAC
jgi:hypothetical protein